MVIGQGAGARRLRDHLRDSDNYRDDGLLLARGGFGRYEVCHSQLYNAAMAAARAGAAKIPNGTAASVSTAAIAAATSNVVDGQAITAGSVTVEYLNWTSKANCPVVTTANFSSATVNAVRVSITYNVPLAFAKVLGLANKAAVEFSVAKVVTQTDTPHVYATGNPWLAGEPAGTQASQPDPSYSSSNPDPDHLYPYDLAGTPGTEVGGKSKGYTKREQYASPVQIAFTVTPGTTITITNTSGSVSYDHDTAAYLDATGNTGTSWITHNAAANNISEHGISDVTMPLGSMVGVFLSNTLPDNNTAPTTLDFSTQASRDYVSLQPKLQQAFYTGTGTTSGGVQQEFLVPPNATRLFMGIMDGWEWNNNNGAFDCTVTQTSITTVQ